MTQLTDKLFAAQVPDWANGFRIETIPQADVFWLVCYEIGDYDEPKQETEIDLPPGTYRFLFATGTATEEDARKVVLSSEWYFPEGHTRYVDYAHPYDTRFKQQWGIGFGAAIDSLRSLLRSKGLDPKNNYAIIEKM